MIAGQIADLEERESILSEKRLEYVNGHKSGLLYEFSARAGAILGSATEFQLQHLGQFGYQLGLAYQALDDICDVTASADKLGKDVNKDLNKTSAVTLYGVSGARLLAKKYLTNALDALSDVRVDVNRLSVLARLIVPL